MRKKNPCVLIVIRKLFKECAALLENLCVNDCLKRWPVSHEAKRFGDQLRRGQLFKDFTSLQKVANIGQRQVSLFYRDQAKFYLPLVLCFSLFKLNLSDAFLDYLFKGSHKALGQYFMREICPVDQECLYHQVAKGIHRGNCCLVLELVRNLEQL